MVKPKVLVLRTAGTNCDQETAFAFVKSGARADLVHVNQLIQKKKDLNNYQIFAIPGGFTYGDDIAAGKILANELRYKLIEGINEFIRSGKLIIGICNGFQILVKSGLLPGFDSLKQEASLVINDSGKFEDRWVYLKTQNSKPKTQKCVWTKGLPEVVYFPIAHGENKFVVKDKQVLNKLKANNQIVFQYCDESGDPADYPDNPNGSKDNIAGICDVTGRILGLMPHPERHLEFTQHPRWTSAKNSLDCRTQGLNKKQGDGFLIFHNGVEYAQKYL